MSARSPIERAFDRAVVYRLCARALGFPGPDRLAEVARLARRAAEAVEGPLRSRMAELAAAATVTDDQRAAEEYVLLFDGAVRCAPCEGAAELEFMSALALKEGWAVAEGHHDHADVSRDASAAFLRDHLGRWAPAFAETLRDVSQIDYYRAVAGVLQPWITTDAEALGVVLAPRPPTPAEAAEHAPPTCPMVHGDG